MSKAMTEQALHDQEWRDYQPTHDPDIDPEKFKVALQKAKRNGVVRPEPSLNEAQTELERGHNE